MTKWKETRNSKTKYPRRRWRRRDFRRVKEKKTIDFLLVFAFDAFQFGWGEIAKCTWVNGGRVCRLQHHAASQLQMLINWMNGDHLWWSEFNHPFSFSISRNFGKNAAAIHQPFCAVWRRARKRHFTSGHRADNMHGNEKSIYLLHGH